MYIRILETDDWVVEYDAENSSVSLSCSVDEAPKTI